MDLFAPVSLGDLQLANRVVMAPLTRLRSGDAGVPGELVAEHYAQRASVGLIITEGTYPNAESRAYPGQPGIVTDEQVAGWRRVAEAVHARGGRIVMQVMHGGRVSHPDITGTDRIVAPSAIAIQRRGAHGGGGKLPYPVPHALTTDEVRATLADIVAASERAVAAGLDGVEIHSANGYLLHEFLSPGVQPAHRRVRRQPGEPRPLRHRGRHRGRRGDRRRQGRHPHLARAQHPGRARDRPRRRAAPPTAPWSTACARWAWPT